MPSLIAPHKGSVIWSEAKYLYSQLNVISLFKMHCVWSSWGLNPKHSTEQTGISTTDKSGMLTTWGRLLEAWLALTVG